jgi:hypothetical protein
MTNIDKNECRYVPFMLSDVILAQWWRPAASSEALDLLHRAMCMVLYQRTAAAIKNGQQSWPIFCCCFVCCCPGGPWGNMEQVVAQWQHPVASGVALDMPHWAMPSVLLRCTTVTIKMANNGGAFDHYCCLFCMIIHSYKTMLWSI